MDRVLCTQVQKSSMDFDTFDTDIFAEINDAPGEIFDIPEMREFAEEIDPEDVVGYDDLTDGITLDSNYDF